MCQKFKQGRKRKYLQNKEVVAFFFNLLRYDNGTAKNNRTGSRKMNCSFS